MWHHKFALVLAALVLQGAPLHVAGHTYDFIVVGAGSAGCFAAKVLAGKGKTLVLERGKPLTEYSKYLHRNVWPKILSTDAVKWYMTPRGYEAQGNAMGGGSTVNHGLLVHPGKAWFDAAGLSDSDALTRAWDAVKSIGSAEYAPSGTVEGTISKVFDNYLNTSQTNEAYTLFASDGGRSTAASVLSGRHENLTVSTSAMVKKLMMVGTKVVGVSYTDVTGSDAVAHLKDASTSRVFLAAGPFETPAILMRSGVGKRSALESLGITVAVEDDNMGSFQERTAMPVQVGASGSVVAARFVARSPSPKYLAVPDVRTLNGNFYEVSGFGLSLWFSSFQMPMNKASERTEQCSTVQRLGLDLLADCIVASQSSVFGVQAIPTGPCFEGTVALTSKDSSEISVGLTYLDSATTGLQDGLKKAMSIMAASELDASCAPVGNETAQNAATKAQLKKTALYCPAAPMVDACVSDPSKCESHRAILPVPKESTAEYATLKDYHGPCWHATGAAASALDADYKVRGLDRVYVVDSSAASTIPPVNPMAAFMVMGRYLADKNSEVIQTSEASAATTEAKATSATVLIALVFATFSNWQFM